MDFTNAGNDMATNSHFDAKAYVRKLDNRKAEEEIANTLINGGKIQNTLANLYQLSPVPCGDFPIAGCH